MILKAWKLRDVDFLTAPKPLTQVDYITPMSNEWLWVPQIKTVWELRRIEVSNLREPSTNLWNFRDVDSSEPYSLITLTSRLVKHFRIENLTPWVIFTSNLLAFDSVGTFDFWVQRINSMLLIFLDFAQKKISRQATDSAKFKAEHWFHMVQRLVETSCN